MKPAVLMVFVDGLGLNRNSRTNPVFKLKLPVLMKITESDGEFILRPLETSLGLPGLPQSATCQTALLTGVNPAYRVKAHKSGFPGPTLRQIIMENSIFKQLKTRGIKSTFANAYRKDFASSDLSWASVTTVSVLSASLSFRTLKDLAKEAAVYQDFTNKMLHKRGYDVSIWSPEKAGQILLDIAANHSFTLYEYFQTDVAGHRNDPEFTKEILQNLDKFLVSILENRPENLTVIITSDHGNIEDHTSSQHTKNPVPAAVWGPHRELFKEVNNLTQIAPLIIALLA